GRAGSKQKCQLAGKRRAALPAAGRCGAAAPVRHTALQCREVWRRERRR
nr:hypothetical protein [Tanacetum cinerariifolium]